MEADDGGLNTAATTAVPVPSPPPPEVPDSSPASSPEIADGVGPVPSGDRPAISAETLTDDLREKIIRQVEYYFSDENLPTDKFLLKYITKGEGYVPIAVIATFRKLKKLTQDRSLITAALKHSSSLVLSPNGKKVKRLNPLPAPNSLPVEDVIDPKLCTVLVENLPEDHSTENIRRIFAAAGTVKNIHIHDPSSVQEPKTVPIYEKLLRAKLHALVEYETVEAAEKAVSLLNNEQDWRFGMRVKPLKRVEKHGQKQKSSRGPDTTKYSSVEAKNGSVEASAASGDSSNCSNEQHDDTYAEEEGDLPSKDKNGHKGRNKRRGRGHNGQSADGQGRQGHGHGTVHFINPGIGHVKPPPGPKMPDGTRGFTMGRGRPLVSSPV